MSDEGTQNAGEGQQKVADEAMEVKLTTGQVYKGTKDEIIAQLQKAQENSSITIKQFRDANESLSQSVDTLRRQQEEQVLEESSATGAFDSKKYFELLATDPPAAFRMQHEALYGETPEQTMSTLRAAYDNAVKNQSLEQILKFRQALGDEWPDTSEASELVWKQGDFDHKPITVGALLEAYSDLKQAGKIKPSVQSKTTEPEEKPRKAPPSARGTGAPDRLTATDERRINKMTPEQIKAEIDKIRGMSVQ